MYVSHEVLKSRHPHDTAYEQFADYVHAGDRNLALEKLQNCIKSRQTTGLKLRLLNTSGHYRWYDLQFIAPPSSINMYIAVAVDIHSAEVQQLRIQQPKKDLKQVLTHELRNPIANALTSVELALLYCGSNTTQTEALLTLARNQIRRLNALLSDITDAPAGQPAEALHYSLLEAQALFNDCISYTANECRQHTVQVQVDGSVFFYGDKIKLERVVCNLLTNAAKYSPPGTTITLSAEMNGNKITLVVKDEGYGIEPVKLPFIFDKYYRAGQPEQKIMGLGLGLYIVKEIIKQHQGEIWAESMPGKGTSFYIVLPFQT